MLTTTWVTAVRSAGAIPSNSAWSPGVARVFDVGGRALSVARAAIRSIVHRHVSVGRDGDVPVGGQRIHAVVERALEGIERDRGAVVVLGRHDVGQGRERRELRDDPPVDRSDDARLGRSVRRRRIGGDRGRAPGRRRAVGSASDRQDGCRDGARQRERRSRSPGRRVGECTAEFSATSVPIARGRNAGPTGRCRTSARSAVRDDRARSADLGHARVARRAVAAAHGRASTACAAGRC